MCPRPVAALLLAVSLVLCASLSFGQTGPPGEAGWIKRKIEDLRRPAHQLSARIKRSAVGRAWRVIARRAKQASKAARGQMTRVADRIERGASPSLARKIHRIRGLSPFSFGAFALHKFHQDRRFLSGYGVFSLGFSNLQTPALIAVGVSPLAAVAIRFATGTPIDLGVLLWREHRRLRRQDPGITLRETVRHLGREYRGFVRRRRAENRRFIAQRQGAGELRRLAAPLASP